MPASRGSAQVVSAARATLSRKPFSSGDLARRLGQLSARLVGGVGEACLWQARAFGHLGRKRAWTARRETRSPVVSRGLGWRPFIQRCSGVAPASRWNWVLWRWSRRRIRWSRRSSYSRRPRHGVAAATAVGRLPAGCYSPGAKCPRPPLPISWRLTDSAQDNVHR
jgi:hypothetical protein